MAAEFKGARLFLNIPVRVAHDQRFKSDKSILLFGEIYSMLNVTGSFYMSNKELAKRLRCKRNTVINCIHELKDLGYIQTKEVIDPETGATRGRAISLTPGVNLNVPPQLNEMDGGGTTNCTQIDHSNRTSNRTNKRSSQTEPDTLSSQCKEVIEYLNEKTGKRFKPNAKGNRDAIYPRLKEGYTVDDMKIVIDNMYSLWHGVRFRNGDLGDNYLKPETLFRSSKIDGYLNANPSTANNQRQRYGKRAPITEPTPEWFKREQEQKEQGEPDQGNWMDQLPDESEVQ